MLHIVVFFVITPFPAPDKLISSSYYYCFAVFIKHFETFLHDGQKRYRKKSSSSSTCAIHSYHLLPFVCFGKVRTHLKMLFNCILCLSSFHYAWSRYFSSHYPLPLTIFFPLGRCECECEGGVYWLFRGMSGCKCRLPWQHDALGLLWSLRCTARANFLLFFLIMPSFWFWLTCSDAFPLPPR